MSGWPQATRAWRRFKLALAGYLVISVAAKCGGMAAQEGCNISRQIEGMSVRWFR